VQGGQTLDVKVLTFVLRCYGKTNLRAIFKSDSPPVTVVITFQGTIYCPID
jgi:hypothetical protein